ncbi:MAG: hypothetical protein J6T04_07595 [Bacteroidales bacterium]|nr:hypothetical protein [Bacteroidales bacterium]
MKRIEDIEKLTDGELEKIALDESVPVPQGLEESLEQMLSAQEGLSQRSRIAVGLSMAAAAVLATFLLLPSGKELKDTFDDPYLAYAEVERTFTKISEKMSEAKEKTLQAASTIDKPISVIRKINK